MFAKQINLLYQYITITLAFLVFKVSYQAALYSLFSIHDVIDGKIAVFNRAIFLLLRQPINLLLLKVSCRKMVGIIANRIWITGNAFQSLMPSKFKGIENLCHHLFLKKPPGIGSFYHSICAAKAYYLTYLLSYPQNYGIIWEKAILLINKRHISTWLLLQ